MKANYVRLRQNKEQRSTVQEMELAGVRVRLKANYCPATDRWFLSILDLADALIVGPIPLVAGVDLLRPYRHLAVPQGLLYCVTKEGEEPSFESLDVTGRVIFES